jgi:L-asparaginase
MDGMKKKILLIHTGGTIGMVRDETSGVLKPDHFYEHLLNMIPELSSVADIEVEIPFLFDSAELDFSHWQALAGIIRARIGRTDGVVITHGTDTLAYTASALSFMLQNLPIPVVLTGAQKPLAELRSDARANLVNAVELATAGIPEVALCFDNRLMRGNRTSKSHISHFDAFTSPNYPPLAEVGLNIDIYWQNVRKPTGLFHLFERFENTVAVLRLFPGCDCSWFQPGPEVRAVLIVAFGAGTVPLLSGNLPRRVETWLGDGRTVALMSEARGGCVAPQLYESGDRLLKLGVLPGADMTFEATVTKLMFLLGQYRDNADVRRGFLTSLAGEMSGTD